MHFPEGVCDVSRICLQVGDPTLASVPHSAINGYKCIPALSVETEDTFPLAEKVIDFMVDPSASTAVASVTIAPAKVEAKEELEESSEDMGFGLLD